MSRIQPISTKATAVAHYDTHAAAMQNQDYFYSWLLDVARLWIPQSTTTVCDVGCGTGALISRLAAAGYTALSGVDFSEGCLRLARASVPGFEFAQHDIELVPLPHKYEAILLTGVIDLLPDPIAALTNLRLSLAPGGRLFVTFRNRWAYWPWYHIRYLAQVLPRDSRLRHWFLHFTTPLGMRRFDQPFEKIYSPSEGRRLLKQAGLQSVAELGMMFLPMVWIPDLPLLTKTAEIGDRVIARRIKPMRFVQFQYLFVCQSLPTTSQEL